MKRKRTDRKWLIILAVFAVMLMASAFCGGEVFLQDGDFLLDESADDAFTADDAFAVDKSADDAFTVDEFADGELAEDEIFEEVMPAPGAAEDEMPADVIFSDEDQTGGEGASETDRQEQPVSADGENGKTITITYRANSVEGFRRGFIPVQSEEWVTGSETLPTGIYWVSANYGYWFDGWYLNWDEQAQTGTKICDTERLEPPAAYLTEDVTFTAVFHPLKVTCRVELEGEDDPSGYAAYLDVKDNDSRELSLPAVFTYEDIDCRCIRIEPKADDREGRSTEGYYPDHITDETGRVVLESRFGGEQLIFQPFSSLMSFGENEATYTVHCKHPAYYQVKLAVDDPSKGCIYPGGYYYEDDPEMTEITGLVVTTGPSGTLYNAENPFDSMTAAGKKGYVFDHWELNGESLDAAAYPKSFDLNKLTFTQDSILTACFREAWTTTYIVRIPEEGTLKIYGKAPAGMTDRGFTIALTESDGISWDDTADFIFEAYTAPDAEYRFDHWECKDDQGERLWSTWDYLYSADLGMVEGGGTVYLTAVYNRYYDAVVFARPNIYSYGRIRRYTYRDNTEIRPGAILDDMEIPVDSETGHLYYFKEREGQDPDLRGYLEAVPNPGFVFSHWEINGENVLDEVHYPGRDGGMVFEEDTTIVAVFEPDPRYLENMIELTLTAQKDGKVQVGSDETETFSLMIYRPKPTFPFITTRNPEESGYSFKQWTSSLGGDPVTEQQLTGITLPESGSVTFTAEYIWTGPGEEPSEDPGTGGEGSDPGGSGSGNNGGNSGGDNGPDEDTDGSKGSDRDPSKKGSGSDPESAEAQQAKIDAMFLEAAGDEAPAGSEFGRLQLRATQAKKTSIKLKWNAVGGATEYVIYGAKCKEKNLRVGVAGSTSFTVNGLKKGTYYKFMVAAVAGSGAKKRVLAFSKMIHEATAGGRVGNPKRVTTAGSALKLKAGRSKKIKAQLIKPAGKKVRTHRKICYESSDEKVAVVNRNGKVKAVGKGKCVVYVYAQNGLFRKVRVTVV